VTNQGVVRTTVFFFSFFPAPKEALCVRNKPKEALSLSLSLSISNPIWLCYHQILIIYLFIYHVYFQIREIITQPNHHFLSILDLEHHRHFFEKSSPQRGFFHLLYRTYNIKMKIGIFTPVTTAPESETTVPKILCEFVISILLVHLNHVTTVPKIHARITTLKT
jgi:hypothetical protein